MPFTQQHEYIDAYQQSRRRDADIAIVSCCFRIQLEEQPPKNEDDGVKNPIFTVKLATLAYGGMAVKVVTAPTTQTFLVGKEWNENLLKEVYGHLAHDLPLEPGAPGGMIEYRRSLTTSFFFKFYLHVTDQLYSMYVTDFSFSWQLVERFFFILVEYQKNANLLLLHTTDRYPVANNPSRINLRWPQ